MRPNAFASSLAAVSDGYAPRLSKLLAGMSVVGVMAGVIWFLSKLSNLRSISAMRESLSGRR